MKYPRRTCIDKAYPKDDPSADLQLFSRGGFYSTKEKERRGAKWNDFNVYYSSKPLFLYT